MPLPGSYMERFRHYGPWEGDVIRIGDYFEPLQSYTRFPKVGEGQLYEVYDVNGEKLVVYAWAYLRHAYGIWVDRIAQGRTDICVFDPAIQKQPRMNGDWFFGICGLQKALLAKDRPVLHGSYISWQNEGILFTAPSGTGKSTQARLWEEYMGAEILNGDRVLLGKREGRWFAHGFPNCGSSDICVNKSLPVRAIVVLRQGKENCVRPMTTAQKLRDLASAMVVYRWDGEDIAKAASVAAELLETVPVVELVCRPDREAVEVLKDYLEGAAR